MADTDKTRTPTRPLALEDAVLVRQVREGNAGALGTLVAKYQDRVVNLCWRMSGQLDLAQDLAQETFLRVLEKLDTYRSEASFYTWLFRIAVNECLAHRRKHKRVILSLHNGDEDWADTTGVLPAQRQQGDRQDPLAWLTTREMQDELAAALDRLDDDHRAVVVLRDIESLSYEQIAKVLDLSTGTVKSRLHRARMTLREILLRDRRVV